MKTTATTSRANEVAHAIVDAVNPADAVQALAAFLESGGSPAELLKAAQQALFPVAVAA